MADSPTASGPLQVCYQNTVEDWKSLQRAYAAAQRFTVRWRPLLTMIALFAVCALPATALLTAAGRLTAVAAGWGVMLLLIGATAWLAARSLRPPDPKILRPATLTLHPQFLEAQSDRGWERRDWSLIAQVQGTDDLIVFHRSDGLVFAVPRRAFPSPQAAEEFFQTAQRLQEQAQARGAWERAAPWQHAAGPPSVFAADTLQVAYSTDAPELREMQAGAVLQPVDESPRTPRRSQGWAFWLVLLMMIYFVFFLRSRDGLLVAEIFTGAVAFLGTTVAAFFPALWVWRRIAARRQARAPAVRQVVTISPKAAALWAPGLETRTAWESIDAVQENNRVVALTANRPTLVYLCVIPKSAFPDEYEARRFVETAARYRRAAADRLAEEELAGGQAGGGGSSPMSDAPLLESGNPYQPPQAR